MMSYNNTATTIMPLVTFQEQHSTQLHTLAASSSKSSAATTAATNEVQHLQHHHHHPGASVRQCIKPAEALALHSAFEDLCLAHTTRLDRVCPPSDARRFTDSVERVTVFHSRAVPAALPLYAFGTFLLGALGVPSQLAAEPGVKAQVFSGDDAGSRLLSMTIVLAARYCLNTRTVPTAHLMHRLYLGCFVVAFKAHHEHQICEGCEGCDDGSACEACFSNSRAAIVAGVRPGELNALELEVLQGLRWCALVSDAQLQYALVNASFPLQLLALSEPDSGADDDDDIALR